MTDTLTQSCCPPVARAEMHFGVCGVWPAQVVSFHLSALALLHPMYSRNMVCIKGWQFHLTPNEIPKFTNLDQWTHWKAWAYKVKTNENKTKQKQKQNQPSALTFMAVYTAVASQLWKRPDSWCLEFHLKWNNVQLSLSVCAGLVQGLCLDTKILRSSSSLCTVVEYLNNTYVLQFKQSLDYLKYLISGKYKELLCYLEYSNNKTFVNVQNIHLILNSFNLHLVDSPDTCRLQSSGCGQMQKPGLQKNCTGVS